jgi:nitrogen regulatory protein PII
MNDEPQEIKYLVLICEEAIENLVGRDIIEAGAKGFTVTTVRGRGNRGVRDAQWLLSSNIRIEVLCNEVIARRIVKVVEEKFAKNYGLIVFILDARCHDAQRY